MKKNYLIILLISMVIFQGNAQCAEGTIQDLSLIQDKSTVGCNDSVAISIKGSQIGVIYTLYNQLDEALDALAGTSDTIEFLVKGLTENSNFHVIANTRDLPTNNSIVFDGSNYSYVKADTFQLDTATIEAWFNSAGNESGYNGIIGTQWNYGIFINEGEFGAYNWGDNAKPYGWVGSGIYPGVGEWHHAALSFQENITGGAILYYDGIAVDTFLLDDKFGTKQFQIGAGLESGGQYFEGEITDVRVWSDVRTADEIRDNMYVSLEGNEEGLLAYYDFSTPSASKLEDITTNDFDVTLSKTSLDSWNTLENTECSLTLTSEVTVAFECVDGLNYFNSNDITISPNPSAGQINFSEVLHHVMVINNTGKVVIRATEAKNLDLSDLNEGIYQIISDELSKKLILQ